MGMDKDVDVGLLLAPYVQYEKEGIPSRIVLFYLKGLFFSPLVSPSKFLHALILC